MRDVMCLGQAAGALIGVAPRACVRHVYARRVLVLARRCRRICTSIQAILREGVVRLKILGRVDAVKCCSPTRLSDSTLRISYNDQNDETKLL